MSSSTAQIAPITQNFSAELRNGLSQLLKAYDYARELECPLWDFSVEMERLLALGITTSDLRWLIKRGYVSHAQEVTGAFDSDRRFDGQSHNLAFSPRTCFVLTSSGLAILGRQLPVDDLVSAPSFPAAAANRQELAIDLVADHSDLPRFRGGEIPNWDKNSRTFLVGSHLVKQFRVPSPNQEAVLEAFQEEGWPQSVDDPLPPVADQQPKRRLRDTIKSLNLNQASPVIRFRGDGTGQRVRWELLADANGPYDIERNQDLRRAA